MQWSRLLEYIQQGEDYKSKFIRQVIHDDQLGPTLVAMANTNGGKVIIGFDINNYHLVGTDISEKFITHLITNHCYPQPNVTIEICEKNEKKVIMQQFYHCYI